MKILVTYVADTHNAVDLPSYELASLMYPQVQIWKRPVQGTESLLDLDRVRTLIGFAPEYSINRLWADAD
jgi:hypothetical protein